jgi:uncharacterized membrane protein
MLGFNRAQGGTMIVSMIRFVLGFAAAALIAGLVQVAFVAGPDLVTADLGRLQTLGLLMALAATQSAVFAAPFAILAALVASWQPIRSRLYFIAVGLAIGLAGFFAQYAAEAGPDTILNRYALAAYALAGLAGGLAYGIIAVPKSRPKKPA